MDDLTLAGDLIAWCRNFENAMRDAASVRRAGNPEPDAHIALLQVMSGPFREARAGGMPDPADLPALLQAVTAGPDGAEPWVRELSEYVEAMKVRWADCFFTSPVRSSAASSPPPASGRSTMDDILAELDRL